MSKLLFTLLLSIPAFCHAQLDITAIKRSNQQRWIDSFPLVRSTNPATAQKINETLQQSLLDNEIIETDSSKIFKKVEYIRNDSIWQTGIEKIGYEVILNSPHVLSLAFQVQAITAYPQSFTNYYSFDAQTGEEIAGADLFTPEGIIFLKKHLVTERLKLIDKHISGDMEDSADVRERLTECAKSVDMSMIVLKKESVLFYESGCLPHAMQAYDMNLNITLSYKVLRKYLTPAARKLLGL